MCKGIRLALSKENFRAAARSLRHAKRMDVPRVDYEKLASDRAGELDDTSKALMRGAMNQLGMSARAFRRALKLARTIADLVGTEQIQATHLAETIHLRSPRRHG